ncbi:TPA: HDIG domain-containing protein [Thermoplasmata archaeon]|nr:HDIG domain-containing protein [Thermoplasmata archaeon]
MLRHAGCSEAVVAHCIAVSEVATRMAKRLGATVSLVQTGALLHDIGRSRSHAIDHAVVGAEVAAELGLPEAVVLIIERHIGAGIAKDQAARLGLPVRDYVPETLEEKIVAHADNLIAGGKRVTLQETVADLTRRGLTEVAAGVMRLHAELSTMAGVDVDRIV